MHWSSPEGSIANLRFVSTISGFSRFYVVSPPSVRSWGQGGGWRGGEWLLTSQPGASEDCGASKRSKHPRGKGREAGWVWTEFKDLGRQQRGYSDRSS